MISTFISGSGDNGEQKEGGNETTEEGDEDRDSSKSPKKSDLDLTKTPATKVNIFLQ